MKYVLLGNMSPESASKQSERVGKAKAKLDKLGIQSMPAFEAKALAAGGVAWPN